MPYDAEEARGLLKAAIRDPDPCIFLENELLYGLWLIFMTWRKTFVNIIIETQLLVMCNDQE